MASYGPQTTPVVVAAPSHSLPCPVGAPGAWSFIFTTAAIAAITLAAFWGVWDAGLVNFDDDLYVSNNPHVTTGLSGGNVRWALSTVHVGNWHPLTWLSLQLDASLFKGKEAGYHITNLVVHVLNAILLMWFWRRVAGAVWAGAIVALLFAVHPLHVESVAWVTERKEVLGTFFGLLAMVAYTHYVDKPSALRYLPVAVSLVLSPMAKPMLVTLPCLLLVLDAWPLGRARPRVDPATGETVNAWPRLVVEKLPLFAIVVAFSLLTARTQADFGAVQHLGNISLAGRLQTALAGYEFYLRKAVWPVDLAVFYPRSQTVASSAVLISAAALVAITALAVWQRRRCPYLLVGWLWFVGTLVPVIGLVQVGDQAFADRYSYFPLTGIFLAVAMALEEIRRSWPRVGIPLIAAAFLGIVALAVVSHRQVAHWRDSESLWRHALAVTDGNYSAHAHLADVLLADGRTDEGVEHANEALRIFPSYAKHLQFAQILLGLQRYDEAVDQYRAALVLEPNSAETHLALGRLLLKEHRYDEAQRVFEEAVSCQTDWAEAWMNLGALHAVRGDNSEALRCYNEALQLDGKNAECLNNIGQVLTRQGKYESALRPLDQALKLNPRYAEASSNKGNALAYAGRLAEAAAAYQDAIEQQPEVASHRFNLAGVLTERGETDLAQRQYRQAMRLDPRWPERASQEAWKLATSTEARQRDGVTALRLAKQACQAVTAPSALSFDALAAAYAETGDFERAESEARHAAELARTNGEERLALDIERRLELYRNKEPYREAE
jgi:tetratricopeptide (TPR) repeat protein